MNPSIRRRLLVAVLSAVLFAWSVMAVSGYLDIRYEVEELLDAQIVQSARVLLAFNTTHLEQQTPSNKQDGEQNEKLPDIPKRLFGHRYESRLAFQIWTNENKLALRSANAPVAFPLTDKEYGFDDRTVSSHRWRVFSLPDDNSTLVVKVGQRYDIRQELISNVATKSLVPIIVVLPILALLIWLGIGRAMAPLVRLARQVEIRAPNHLQPVDTGRVPKEARPLINSLNNLFKRLEMAFDGERRFTSDAAHELRTPLAGLKAQAHVALKSNNTESREKALNQMVKGVDHATHLVQQLLTLARLDPDTGLAKYEDVNLTNVTSEVLANLIPYAESKNINLGLYDQLENTSNLIKGNKDVLAILFRNLVDNAIRYTPENGTIDVTISTENDLINVSIADSGPGIPEEDREQVFKRFYRRLVTQASGSGLGLSIASRIAELHHASIKLSDSKYKGLQIDISFLPSK